MFYSNNDSYMQDLYFYNQMPNPTYMNNIPNGAMNNQPQNPMMNNNMMYNNQNFNSYYPSIYRIITPVVSNVVINSNYQYLNEDSLNNMVETVYNIVDGQIDYEEDNNQSSNMTSSPTSNTQSTSQNNSSTISRTSESKPSSINTKNSKNDSLLKDIIKILILKELQNRRGFSNRQCNYQQYYGQQPYNMNIY